ncbi:MAG: glycosyltransferase family 4 protein [Clostridia bacterium]|nr:glycosyltransferase family 4 protein [Clostridia bacterium]
MGREIWILNHYAIPPGEPGGTRHYDISKELVERGNDVSVFASSLRYQTKKEVLGKKEKYRLDIINGVKFVWIKTFRYSGNDWRRVINMLSFAFNLFFISFKFKKPDIIIGSSVHLFTCLSGYIISFIRRVPFILEIRDLWPQTLIDMGALKEKSITARVFRAIEYFLYKKALKIIVLLPNAGEYITKLGISSDKIVYIPNGVDIDRFDKVIRSGEVSRPNNIFEKHSKNFNVTYLGVHGEANGLDTLVDAAKVLEKMGYGEINIILIGDGPNKEKLIASAKEKGVSNIFFYNPVPKEQVPLILSWTHLNVFILKKLDTFKYGISANKLFDYLCSAKPMIFSCSSENDICKQANCGITVEPENPQELAKAIIEFYKMAECEREALGLNGRRYVENNHNIKSLANKLIQLVEGVLK